MPRYGENKIPVVNNKMSLEIETQGAYKSINLKKLKNNESVVVTKKYAEAKRSQKDSKFYDANKPEDKFNKKTYTVAYTQVEYNGEDKVGIFFFYYDTEEGRVSVDAMADKFDAVGGEGDNIKITKIVTMGQNEKGDDVAFTNYTFDLVE
jgi:hypothetical protein